VTTVRIPPTLRDETGGQAALEARGGTVREVLDDVSGRFPALRARIYSDGELARFVNVYVGGEDVRTRDGLETTVDDGSTVILLPAMAGGCLAPLAGERSRPAEQASIPAEPAWPRSGIASDAFAASALASARWPQDAALAGLVVTLGRVAFAPGEPASFASERPENRGCVAACT
jgi:molybdopterin converting factor small subunit